MCSNLCCQMEFSSRTLPAPSLEPVCLTMDCHSLLRRSLVFLLLFSPSTFAAFTLPTSESNNFIQQNSHGTWCYFPAAGQTRATTCTGDYELVMEVHLNQTISIGYYGPDNTRLGGAEWAIPVSNPGKVNLCASGRAEDGSYQSICAEVTEDNSLGGVSNCQVAVGQNSVTDGCYVAGQSPYDATASSFFGASTFGASGTRLPAATVTVTSLARPREFSGVVSPIFKFIPICDRACSWGHDRFRHCPGNIFLCSLAMLTCELIHNLVRV
jgi:hypothetical protein